MPEDSALDHDHARNFSPSYDGRRDQRAYYTQQQDAEFGVANHSTEHLDSEALSSLLPLLKKHSLHTSHNQATRIAGYLHAQQVFGNRAVLRYVQRQAATEAPDLHIKGGLDEKTKALVLEMLKNDKNGNKRQVAINTIVDALIKSGDIDKKLLGSQKSKIGYDPKLKRTAQSGARTRDKKVLPADLKFGPKAFKGENSKGEPFKDESPEAQLSWLYSTTLHEYQHVLQSQKTAEGRSRGSDKSSAIHGIGWSAHLRHQQEAEAYASEIINSKKTGVFDNPEQMEEIWTRFDKSWKGRYAKNEGLKAEYEEAKLIYEQAKKAQEEKIQQK